MFKKNTIKAERQKSPALPDKSPKVRGRKYEVSTAPRAEIVSMTEVKNPVDIDVPDDYNPANKYGMDDRLLDYFYTKKEIDAMGGFPDWEIPDKPVPDFEDMLLRIAALERHTHSYDGDLIENDLPF